MSNAKSEILANIRRATGGSSAERVLEYAAILRDYQLTGNLDFNGRLELFADRLRDYGSGFHSCSEPEIAFTVAGVLRERGKKRRVIPPHISANWLPCGFDFLEDNGLDNLTLDAVDGVITGCTLAVASTGPIILHHSAVEGRRALTLIPDYHLCVVFADQLVETVPELCVSITLRIRAGWRIALRS